MRHKALTTVGAFLGLILSTPAYATAPTCGIQGFSPIVSVTESDETLVVWDESCPLMPFGTTRAELTPERTAVAIGSPKTGYAPAGTVNPASGASEKGLSRPSSALLEAQGNGWIAGVNDETFHEAERDGSSWRQDRGAWLAFRPAGERFGNYVELPTAGAEVVIGPLLAGNGSGVTLVGWSTRQGSYLAWTTASGGIRRLRFYRKLELTAISVDPSGLAFVVGYYPSALKYDRAAAILTIDGRAGAALSPARVLVPTRRYRHGHLLAEPTIPAAATAPNGEAFIAWQTEWVTTRRGIAETEREGARHFVLRAPDGRFGPTRKLRVTVPNIEQGQQGGEGRFVVDDLGQTSIMAEPEADSFMDSGVSPRGHVRSRSLPGFTGFDPPTVTGDGAGEIAIYSSGEDTTSFKVILGRSTGLMTRTQTIDAARDIGGVTTVIDGRGDVTTIWAERLSPLEGELTNTSDVLKAMRVERNAPTVEVSQGAGAPTP